MQAEFSLGEPWRDRHVDGYTGHPTVLPSMTFTFPTPIGDAVTLLQQGMSSQNTLLLDVLASIVHPDMVCSLFELRHLKPEIRALAVRCIDYAVITGLDVDQAAALYAFVGPRIAARF